MGGVLAGCGTGVSAGVAAPEVVPIADQPWEDSAAGSPLEDFLDGGVLSGAGPSGLQLSGPDLTVEVERYREEDLAAQETVAACMAEQGFAYVPYLPEEPVLSAEDAEDAEDPAAGLTRGEFAARYGFGISFEVELGWAAYSSDLVFADDSAVADDPNEATRAALDEAGQAAWDVARNGGGYDGGCEAAAYDDQNAVDPASAVLEAQLQVLEAEILADPRSVEALGEYTVCMGAADYDVGSADDAYMLASDRYYSLLPDPFADLSEDELAALSPAELDALAVPGEADPAELAVVQAEEVEMAVTDLRCRADAEPVLDAVRAERETEFLAGNRAELEVLRESYGG